ncbi:hypothetical protein KBC70_00295 [Candidatus Woesebacteria bacterium]|nr:hypothetical protein [Candidatus Woesebacteria bacterium]
MALKKNMTIDEMIRFINDELLHQAKDEIQNWIYPKKKSGGYFVVSRQILCIVDFLGSVYAGYPLIERKADKEGRRISTPQKSKEFITKFFEPQNIYNPITVDLLYRMYRNGLVHLYQPKILKFGNKGRLQWALYRGKRDQTEISFGSDTGNVTFRNVSHLQIVPNKLNQSNWLLICIDSLYEDFEKAIFTYRDTLSGNKSLQTNWRTTVNAICKPR